MTAAFDPDDPATIEGGRRFPYSTGGDWVTLSPISHLACRVYWVLRAHVNRDRGDDRAWPSQRRIAELLNIKKPDTVRLAVLELIELGAVDVEIVPASGPGGRRNIYTVHEAPPEGYAGPVHVGRRP